jgi:hypothetical protein
MAAMLHLDPNPRAWTRGAIGCVQPTCIEVEAQSM